MRTNFRFEEVNLNILELFIKTKKTIRINNCIGVIIIGNNGDNFGT